MHPQTTYDMVKFKIEEELQHAARERLAQAARSDRPRSIDFSSIGQRLKARLFGGSWVLPRPRPVPGRLANSTGSEGHINLYSSDYVGWLWLAIWGLGLRWIGIWRRDVVRGVKAMEICGSH
jgi:hypothetical protein